MSMETTTQNPSPRSIGIQNFLASALLLAVMVFGLWQMAGASRNLDLSTVPLRSASIRPCRLGPS
jgi:hypothetical protein